VPRLTESIGMLIACILFNNKPHKACEVLRRFKMPCRDYEDDTNRQLEVSSETIAELRKQNDRLARIACVVMTQLEEEGITEDFYDGNEEVAEWWEAHKKADAENFVVNELHLELLRELNNIATNYDMHDFGLPIGFDNGVPSPETRNLLKAVAKFTERRILKQVNFDKVNRVEIIDDKGREYANHKVNNVFFQLQDGDKTLKIFVNT
jgi:hypothetical protein